MTGNVFDDIPNPSKFYKELGILLMATRQKLGLSQKDVARAFGVTFQQIQKYESAETRIPVYFLYRFARAFGVSFAGIFGADFADCDYRVLDAARVRGLIDNTRDKLNELQEFLINKNQ